MSRQFWSETLAWATSRATAIASTTTETVLVPNTTIPANYMQDGRAIRIRASGAYGTTGTPTLQLRIRWGGVSGTVLGATGAAVTSNNNGSGASMTALWLFDGVIQTRSNGSSGTLFTTGELELFTSTVGSAGTVTHYGMPVVLASGSTGGTTPVAVTADLTADTALSFTATWGTSNSANSIACDQFYIEGLN